MDILQSDDPNQSPAYPNRIDQTRDGLPLVNYQVTIIPAQLKVELVFNFVNFPAREELVAWCRNFVVGLYEEHYQLLIEGAEWPRAMSLERNKLSLKPTSLGRPLGEIRVDSYAMINNPGKLEIVEPQVGEKETP